MSPTAHPLHAEVHVEVDANAATLFDYLDDPRRLGSHMERGSWKTGGAKMWCELDAGEGRAVGSQIKLGGRVAGLALSLIEVVTERDRPVHKVWETTVAPRLLVVGAYRMGFDIRPFQGGSELRMFIDYAPGPVKPPSLGAWLARRYAQWCLRQMSVDAADHFKAARH